MTGFLDPCPLPMEWIYRAPITVLQVLAICFNLSRHFIPRDDCVPADIREMIRRRETRGTRKTLPRAHTDVVVVVVVLQPRDEAAALTRIIIFLIRRKSRDSTPRQRAHTVALHPSVCLPGLSY